MPQLGSEFTNCKLMDAIRQTENGWYGIIILLGLQFSLFFFQTVVSLHIKFFFIAWNLGDIDYVMRMSVGKLGKVNGP